MNEKIRWGILGTGNIAHKFATGLTVVDDAELVAVGSRTQEGADKFADEFGATHRHASYEALANDPEVDAIYVSTPHPFHKDNSILCLNAGKAVLCEKPFTINTREAEEVIAVARAKKLFLMEAMWTRYAPVMFKIRELIGQGVIGEVRMINADFGFRAGFDPKSRTFAPELGGGGLLDVGIYPISLASMLLGEPSEIISTATLGETGVDEQSVVLLKYAGGQIAITSSAVRTTTPWEAFIMGTEGMIHIPAVWWKPEAFTLKANGEPDQRFDLPFTGNGYNYEAIEVGRCLRAGELESPVMPLDETLSIMRTMDAARAQWGLVYPTERV
ncbi:MAG: Gfo/Idh/MocA family oxidoreductase [Chloroflexota bacterium]